MPDPIPTTDAQPRARRHAGPPERAPEAEALALVERSAGVPDALAILRQAPLECAAVLLRAEPRVVERVRAALADPALLEEAALRLARAARARPPTRAAAAGAGPGAPRDPEALLSAARARDGGLALLLDAAPECAAIAFGVHPDLVHRAREAARRERPGAAAPPRP